MVWTFIILGLLTSAWSLYALIASFITKQNHRAAHATAVVLLALAWTLGHETGLGRLALIAAIVIECVVRFRTRRSDETTTETAGQAGTKHAHDETEASAAREKAETLLNDESQAESEIAPQEPEPPSELSLDHVEESLRTGDEAAEEPEAQPPSEQAPMLEPEPLTSCVLLPTAWTLAPSVFHASLRRGGQRDAVLLDDESEENSLVVRVGDIRIDVTSVPEPRLRSQVNAAARLAWEWPEATQAVRTYAAHVVFKTIAPENTCPRDLVHLHHRAQTALAEFTSPVAIFWPAAGRLMSPSSLVDLVARPDDAAAMSASCVSFRVFEPQTDGEPYVLDSAGLHALGLPDLQAFSYTEPDDTISAMLYEQAERLFLDREALAAGMEIAAADGRVWQVDLQWSNREPRRPVLSLSRPQDEPAPESDAAPQADEPTPFEEAVSTAEDATVSNEAQDAHDGIAEEESDSRERERSPQTDADSPPSDTTS